MSKTSLASKLLSRRFMDELDRILYQHNRKVYSTNKIIMRDCSQKTRIERRNNLRLCFAELHQLGYRLETPRSLKQKHIFALAAHWKTKNLSAKTIHGLFSNLRQFCLWVDKQNIVLDTREYYKDDKSFISRRTQAERDLSWENRGLNLSEIFAQAKAIDPRLEIYLRLMRFFGLRVKEAIEFRPRVAVAIDDDYILVSHGTKGGKHRVVKIRNDQQRRVLCDAKTILGHEVNMRLRWPAMTWRQAQSHYYYLMRRLAITNKLAGISTHGLRHAFLQDEYEIYARVPAAIKNTGVLPDIDDHKRANLVVSLEAGHYRPYVSVSYCGSFGYRLRQGKKSSSPDLPAVSTLPQEKDDLP